MIRKAHNKISRKIKYELGKKLLRGNKQFNFVTSARYVAQKHKYAAPANPYRPIWINPNDINDMCTFVRPEWGLGQIITSNLEKRSKPYNNRWRVEGLKQRFEQGYDWEDTIFFEEINKRLEQNVEYLREYDSFDHYKKVRLTYVDDLFETIQDEGYRPNFEAEHNVPEEDVDRNAWHFLEPLVIIGRSGDLYFRDGWHRFTIARILNIDSVPVNVLGRHYEWQRKRERIHKSSDLSSLNSTTPTYLDHPDLEDISPNDS